MARAAPLSCRPLVEYLSGAPAQYYTDLCVRADLPGHTATRGDASPTGDYLATPRCLRPCPCGAVRGSVRRSRLILHSRQRGGPCRGASYLGGDECATSDAITFSERSTATARHANRRADGCTDSHTHGSGFVPILLQSEHAMLMNAPCRCAVQRFGSADEPERYLPVQPARHELLGHSQLRVVHLPNRRR